MRRLLLVAALCIASTATAGQPAPRPTPLGRSLVFKLADVTDDRLHSFASVLGAVSGFPGSAPSHQKERLAFEKELAIKLGVPSVSLAVVANPMVGDEKDPPVSTLTITLTDEQLRDALSAIGGQHGAKPEQSPSGKVWTLGRIAVHETDKTLSWGWSRPPLSRPDWDAASVDAMRSALLSIVRDASTATLVKFVEDLKKRTTQRSPAEWDDPRATYSFNVTDARKSLSVSFGKPFHAGPFLKELGISEVTFGNPCDADYIVLHSARTEPLKYGNWGLSLRTVYVPEYDGAVQHCTSHSPVKAVPAANVTIRSARLTWEGK